MGTGWGSGGGDGGGSSGDISSQKATREAGAVEIRSLSEALRAAEEVGAVQTVTVAVRAT